MSLWELNAVVDGYQEANGGKPKGLNDEDFEELSEVIDTYYGR